LKQPALNMPQNTKTSPQLTIRGYCPPQSRQYPYPNYGTFPITPLYSHNRKQFSSTSSVHARQQP
ncbi:MAG: hypothetical protein ACK53Y_10020, partial [bacterium]